MAMLELEVKTHGDDLRGGSWANFYLKLRNRRTPIEWEQFTGRGGLPGNSFHRFRRDFPELTDPDQIEFFRVEHVSQESFPQTADNWEATITVNIVSPVELASTGRFYYQGNQRDKIFHPG